MSLLPDFLTRLVQTVTADAGDERLMQAGVSAAANVIVADGAVAGEEIETALIGVLTDPIAAEGCDLPRLDGALTEAIGRARTMAGRTENLRRVAMVATRPIAQREGVFLMAVDVAEHGGIAPVEDAALAEIALALIVEKARLLRVAAAVPMPRRSAA